MEHQLGLVEEKDPSGSVILRVSGELDAATCPHLREKLTDIASHLPGRVVLDLADIDFIDSSALGVILSSWKTMKAQDAELVVATPQERVTRLFELTALNLSIAVFPTVAEAVAGRD